MGKKPGWAKKEKPPPNLEPEYTLTKEQLEALPKKKKKAKNAPDKQQPAWLHPPDEDNPVLNPKPKDEETRAREKVEHDKSIDFLRRRAVGAPTTRKAPPGVLINLVGAFLSSWGFDNASRLYTAHLRQREKIDDWKIEYGKGLPKDYPTLVRIFNDFHRKWEVDHADDSSESEAEMEKQNKSKKSKKKRKAKDTATAEAVRNPSDDETSSSGSSSKDGIESDDSSDSDSDSDSQRSGVDIQMTDAPPTAAPQVQKQIIEGSSPSSSDEEESSPTKAGASLPPSANLPQPATTTPSALDDVSSSSSDSDSLSDSPVPATGDESPEKSFLTAPEGRSPEKSRTTSDTSSTLSMPAALKPSTTSSPPSSPSSSSASSSSLASASASKPANPLSNPTDSAISTTTKRPATSSDSETTHNPKRAKKSTTTSERFQRIPPSTAVDPRFASNEYVPHSYGEQAHADFSVTKGKGFTKEKNKKKRGSYRGGFIGVEGGGGVRFDE